MYGEAYAFICKTALQNNYRELKKRAGGARLISVVKANAYGHGLAFVAKALQSEGADFFAVARLSEAVYLRRLCPKSDILILGKTPPRFAPLLAKHNLIQSLSSPLYAKELSSAAGAPIRAHLKLDCGMGRFGISVYSPDAIRSCLDAISRPNIGVEAIYSHLPSADLTESDESDAMRIAFRQFTARLLRLIRPVPTHLLATAGLLRYGAENENLIRPGLALYGYPPCKALLSEGFSPVLKLYAPIIAIRSLEKGDRIGYGGAYTAPHSMKIALLGIGYGDGLPRALTGARLSFGKQSGEIVGRICMDLTFCKIANDSTLRVGDHLLLFGDRPETLADLSAHAGTIPYELLTSLSSRLYRRYVP